MFRFYYLLIFITLFTSYFSFAQIPETGKWKGMMQISKDGKVIDSVEVMLTVRSIVADSVWQWKMEYLSEKMPVTKDYKLMVSDRQKGIYLTDEGEGLILMNYLHGRKMYGAFETAGLLLTSTTEWLKDGIMFEVTSGKKTAEKQTDIQNYSVNIVQRVFFKKMN